MSISSDAAIAVFVKTPSLSPVKTRLAAKIGRPAAEHFYRLCLDAIEAVIRQASSQLSVVPYWSVAEFGGLPDDRWSGLSRIAQGPGGLGDRLNRVYTKLLSCHRSVLLIGADGPMITCELIENAIRRLDDEQTPFAISRSRDGGYGLFAGRREIPEHVWTTVPYSTSATAATFVEFLRPIGRVTELPVLDDVDNFDDLVQLAANELRAETLPEQAAVVAFARAVVGGFPTSVDKD